MDGNRFLKITSTAFTPFLRDLGFSIEKPSISGRYYQVRYIGQFHIVTIAYEPGDNAFFVMVSTGKNNQLLDIDDRSKAPRLTDLNKRYMKMVTIEERLTNEAFFKTIEPQDKEENLLLKAAKELRLVLPKHMQSVGWVEARSPTNTAI